MSRLALFTAALLLACGAAHAADEAKAPTQQQNKMVECNQAAAGKKGDERKAFMSDCLKKKPEAKMHSQQDKMKSCNAEAGSKMLKGDERKQFMSGCLKK